MKRLCVLFVIILFVISTLEAAEKKEHLDTYLESLPSSSSSQNLDSDIFVDESLGVTQKHGVVQPQAVEHRTIEVIDGSGIYQEMPLQSAVPNKTGSNVQIDVQEVIVLPEGEISSDVVIRNKTEDRGRQELEVIELEPTQEEYVVIEAPESQSTQSAVTANTNTMSGNSFCQQRPYARECLLSNYLSLCKKDPQSTDCKSQLEKFDNFCGAFPNAYKCKKAKAAATCKKNPLSSACKAFTQRYCQKDPNAIFCNHN